MEGQQPAPPPNAPPPPQMYQPWQPQPAYDPLKELIGTAKSVLWSSGFIAFMFMLILSFVIVLAMTPEIQQWITTPVPSSSDPSVMVLPKEHIFIITPWPMLLFSIDGAAFQAWHLAILGILVAAVAFAKHDLFRSWLSSQGQAVRAMARPEKATSSLEGTAKLFMASISFSMFYFILIGALGVNMDTPDFESLGRAELIYGLFNASVFEELVSRVLLVGVPLVIIGFVQGWKNPIRKILGGGLGLTPTTLALIVFSAVMFAFAHVGSWDLWKVPQVLVTGMALGWAFTRYGLHASILIHFSINLSSSATEIWPESAGIQVVLGLVMLIWIFSGGYFFLHYCIELVNKLAPKAQPAPGFQYPQQTYAQYHQQHQPPPPHWQHSHQPPPPPPWQGQTVPPPPWAQSAPAQQPTAWQPQPAQQPPATQPIAKPHPGAPALQTVRGGITGGFVCGKCGNTDASYDAGRLTCLNCGAVHHKEGEQAGASEKEQIEL